MKKLVFVLLAVVFVANTSFAQSDTETRRFLGTWQGQLKISEILITIAYTFNNDGNGTMIVAAGGTRQTYQIQYMVSRQKLIVNNEFGADVCDYYFSPDGNVLVLGGISIFGNTVGLWLNKR